MTVTKCRGCGADIVFIRTEKGRSMPCDHIGIAYRPAEDGPDTVITMDGKLRRGTICPPGPGALAAHRPHWVTCPQAARMKRTKRKDGER